MSATGRNLEGHERRADDFYATPAWVTRAIGPYLEGPHGHQTVGFDPCCGDGAILNVMAEWWFGAKPIGIEIDAGRAAAAGTLHAVTLGDALAIPWPDADMLVTNPPYALAMAFIERALGWLELGEDREVAFLTRLNFLGSQKRAAFHRQHPCDVYVLPKRPSFTGGGTDATEYCWMVWGPGRGNRWFMLDV